MTQQRGRVVSNFWLFFYAKSARTVISGWGGRWEGGGRVWVWEGWGVLNSLYILCGREAALKKKGERRRGEEEEERR